MTIWSFDTRLGATMDTASRIRAELQSRRGDWPTMCAALDLSYWWLTKFAQGRIREPGLSKIERLQKYFDAHPLECTEQGVAEGSTVEPVGSAREKAA